MDQSTDAKPVDRARAMRKTLTPPEARMWLFLKSLRAQGCHFRRQVPFRGYFLDFACHTHRLVVEVDGASHQARGEHDARRDTVLAKEGYRTLRFTNLSIRDDFHHVQDAIMRALAMTDGAKPGAAEPAMIAPHPDRFAVFPPHEGEGEK